MIYWVIFAIFMLLGASSNFTNRTYSNFSIILFFACFILTAFRLGTGSDFDTYISIWRAFSLVNEPSELDYYYSNIEVGYKYLLYFLSHLSSSNEFFIAINAFIFTTFSYLGLYRLRGIVKLNFTLSVFILFSCFLIPYAFNAMRQAITMSIFIFAMKDILLDRKYRVFFISLLASLIHATGWLILISYLLTLIEIKSLRFHFTIILIGILAYLSKAVSYIFLLLGSSKFVGFSENWGSGTVGGIILRLFMFIFITYIYSKLKSNKYLDKMILMYSFGLCLYFAFYDAGMLASRFNMFFRYLEIIIIPSLLLLSQKSIKFIGFVFMVVICAMQLYLATLNPDNKYIINNAYEIF